MTAHEEPGRRNGPTGVRPAPEGTWAIVGALWGVRGEGLAESCIIDKGENI